MTTTNQPTDIHTPHKENKQKERTKTTAKKNTQSKFRLQFLSFFANSQLLYKI